MDESVTDDLHSIIDFVRYGASRFTAHGLHFGHGTDNAVDESLSLVRHALDLAPDVPQEFYAARLTAAEKRVVIDLFRRRIEERVPAPYLTGRAWFAGLEFVVDERVLVPRSPIAELVERGFEPWLDPSAVTGVLDLCAGSGCIGIACALAFPDARVDLADLSADALDVARLNIERHGVADRVHAVVSDVYSGLGDRRYDLIVSNPPYVDAAEMAALAPEYRHEPGLGLAAGPDGLDVVHRILAGAREHLTDRGQLVVEVGASEAALASAYDHLPLTWIEFERGGSGVFVLSASDLEV